MAHSSADIYAIRRGSIDLSPTAPREPTGKLIIVSNRLPVTLSRTATGEPQFTMSSGGLVSALVGMGRKFSWVGWLGSEIPKDEEEKMRQLLWEKNECVPVFLEKQQADAYYNKFSNGILWPLFHYLFEKEATFDPHVFEEYKNVNKIFAKAVLDVYKPGDSIWVHDYHLMLLPKYLREALPEGKIGFFLHIPFPSSEIYRTLPVRSELIEGVLASNIVGFHTFDYCRHFLSASMRSIGSEVTPKGLIHGGLSVTCGVFPIGIDPQKFTNCLATPECQARIAEFQDNFKGKKIFLGIDRLDYTKGLPQKFQAFERFLCKYPEQRENVVLVQVGVPTREDVQQYQDLVTEVNELCGRINSKYGTVDSVPLHYIHKSVPFVDLCALYYIADVCLVTAVRDGMNLVSYEYVACQRGKYGVLLLSEFTGAASSLSGSVLFNPFDIEATATAMQSALQMGLAERKLRFERNELVVFEQNTAAKWGERFLDEFEQACDPSCYFLTKTPFLDSKAILDKYKACTSRRIFFLDYDGTLVGIQKYPHMASPTPELLRALEKLCADPKNLIYIVSGRDRSDLESWLGHLPVGLTAEHGMVCRHPGTDEWVSLYELDMDISWMKTVEPIFRHVCSRIPGSSLEVKKTSLCFHYRNVEVHYGNWIANELRLHLAQALINMPIDIVLGKKVLEVRCVGVNKGAMVKKLLKKVGDYDFIFCAGDDRTDEDMFEVLHADDKAITCLIGKPEQHTHAESRLASPRQLVEFLDQLGSCAPAIQQKRP